jgi:hypothetical protein
MQALFGLEAVVSSARDVWPLRSGAVRWVGEGADVTPEQQSVLDWEALVGAGKISRATALGLAHDEFGWSKSRYFQLLNSCLDLPEAVASQPMLVNRLRRLRSQRHQDRSTRRLPPSGQ